MTNILSDIEKDALSEIGNIGSGNATSKLANLVGEKINISLTDINVLPISELKEKYQEGEKDNMVSIFLRVKGSIFGTIATMFEKDLALNIIDLMNRKEIGTTKAIDRICEGKLNILGTLLADGYLSSLYQFLEIELKSSEPIIAVNKKNVILNFLIRGISSSASDNVLTIKTEFAIADKNINGELLLLFGLESLDEFKAIIHKKLGI